MQSLARRRESRHRVFRRPRHQRRAALDAREGRDSLRLHRQPRPARRNRLRRDPAQGDGLRRREGAADRVPRAAGRRRHGGAAVRRVSHLHGGADLLQHHAARPRRHRHHARRRDARRRRQHLGRRQHVQGQRHRAVLSLRPARQSEPAHLQAVARSAVHRRARRPQGDVGVHDPARLPVQDERREGLLDRLEHPRRDARSQGSRVPQQGHHDRPADHGRRLLARRRRRSSPRRSRSASKKDSRSRSTARRSRPRSTCSWRPTPSAAGTASA